MFLSLNEELRIQFFVSKQNITTTIPYIIGAGKMRENVSMIK